MLRGLWLRLRESSRIVRAFPMLVGGDDCIVLLCEVRLQLQWQWQWQLGQQSLFVYAAARPKHACAVKEMLR
jgi:hypothetical protein